MKNRGTANDTSFDVYRTNDKNDNKAGTTFFGK
jgi:hypothetical protein